MDPIQKSTWNHSCIGYILWVFPKIVVFTPNHPMFNRVWNHYVHHPFWGGSTPLFLVQHPYTWNPLMTPLLIGVELKRPCFGGLKPQNRGQTHRFQAYIYIYTYLNNPKQQFFNGMFGDFQPFPVRKALDSSN